MEERVQGRATVSMAPAIACIENVKVVKEVVKLGTKRAGLVSSTTLLLLLLMFLLVHETEIVSLRVEGR